MDEFIIGIVISVVVWLIIRVVQKARTRRLLASMPSEAQLQEYLAGVQRIRDNHGGYQEQKQYLLAQGLHEKLVEGLLVVAREEQT